MCALKIELFERVRGERKERNGSIKQLNVCQALLSPLCCFQITIGVIFCRRFFWMTERHWNDKEGKVSTWLWETRINRPFFWHKMCVIIPKHWAKLRENQYSCLMLVVKHFSIRTHKRSAALNKSFPPENSLTEAEKEIWRMKRIAEAKAEWNLSVSMNNEADINSRIRMGESNRIVKWFKHICCCNKFHCDWAHSSLDDDCGNEAIQASCLIAFLNSDYLIVNCDQRTGKTLVNSLRIIYEGG